MSATFTQQDALAILAPLLGDEVVICANGFGSRAAFGARDTATSFYMIGSMGLASSIGLGVALAQPDRRVLVLDGDGNVLMNLGTLATIAATAPGNLLHVCFDNGVHASTGGQRTIADRVDLGAMARTAGYRWVGRATSADELGAVATRFVRGEGPAFLHVLVARPSGGAPGPRIPYTPVEMTTRVRDALARGNS